MAEGPPAYGDVLQGTGYVASPLPTGSSPEKAMQSVPYVTQPTSTMTVIQTTPQGPPPEHLRQRAKNGLSVVLVLMVIIFLAGVVMIIANAIPAGKGVRTYDKWYSSYGNNNRVRRDWYQGIWSGVVHLLVATAFFVIYYLAKTNSFDLDKNSIRGWLYFFSILLSIMAIMAFVAMVMGSITAGFLYNKDGSSFLGGNCQTNYDSSGDVYCSCSGDERVENSDCNDAGRLYYGLFTTIAVLNSATFILFIVAAAFTCVGSCAGCCGGGYMYGGQSVVVPATTVVQAVPQTVPTVQYPVAGQVIGTY